MKNIKINEEYLPGDISVNEIIDDFEDHNFTINDMFMAFKEGSEMGNQGRSGYERFDFPIWIKKNY